MPIPLGILAVAGAGAAGGGGAFDLLETTLISTNTASVTFTGLGAYSDYKHLQIREVSKKEESGTNDSFRVFLNGDTGANYAWHRLEGTGSAVASDGNSSASFGFAAEVPGSTIGVWSSYVLDILDFSSNSKNTTIRALGGWASSTQPRVQFRSTLWANTAAVTSIEMKCGSTSNFSSGSRFSLYGIK